MQRFEGELEHLWNLAEIPPINRLTWDWWWWLIMLEDENHPNRSKQLMVLWSTKETEVIDVNYYEIAERVNGQLAMMGFIAALGAYLFTGQIIPGVF